MSEPIKNYTIHYPNENDERLVVFTLSKPLAKTNFGDAQKLLAEIAQIDGIDAFQPIGRYTFQVIIADTFDIGKVVAEINAILERAVSTILTLPNAKIELP